MWTQQFLQYSCLGLHIYSSEQKACANGIITQTRMRIGNRFLTQVGAVWGFKMLTPGTKRVAGTQYIQFSLSHSTVASPKNNTDLMWFIQGSTGCSYYPL